jgi:hypothetical protein
MTNGGQRPDTSGFRIENETDLLFARAHPNPTREGCPPPELLRRLAGRELPIGDPAYDHFAKCSPCYQELRTLQQADAAKVVAVTKRRRMMIAAAAVLAVAIAGSWFALRRAGDADRIAQPRTQTAPQSARLDLRPLAVTRSQEQKVEAAPLMVPRGRVNATILLPVGSSPGEYDVRILDADLRARATARGSAEIRNYVTTLEAVIDVSALEAGDYQLTLRRDGGEWQMFPLRVR